MRKLYKPNAASDRKSISTSARNMSIEHNLILNVIDQQTGKVVQSHESHNAATNSLLTGIGHYLMGDGIYNQAYDMLNRYVPRYISLGTMGLTSQEEDIKTHLPIGIGGIDDTPERDAIYENHGFDLQTQHICNYASECPGFGADGYQANQNNGRPYFGLGPMFDMREYKATINCELISKGFPRSEISFRDIVPEYEAEIPKTIDVIYSGMIGTSALNQFKELGKDYIFITEAGLWSSRPYSDSGDNGLLAGYRIVPPNQHNWNFGTFVEGRFDPETGQELEPDHYVVGAVTDEIGNLVYNEDGTLYIDEDLKKEQERNQQILKENILRVGRNQVVQVIWKIQLGGLEQLGGMSELYPSMTSGLIWEIWDK